MGFPFGRAGAEMVRFPFLGGGAGHFSAIRGAFPAFPSPCFVVRRVRCGGGGAQFDSDYSGGDDASGFFLFR